MKIYNYPDEKSRCRRCGTHQYIHKNFNGNYLFVSDSCMEYVPGDNLEYLEWEIDKHD